MSTNGEEPDDGSSTLSLSSQGQSWCLSQVAGSQAHWALGKHHRKVCLCNLLPTSNVSFAAKVQCPVTSALDSCISIHKLRLCPLPYLKIRDQRNKQPQCNGNCTVDWANPVWFNDPTKQWWFFWQQSPTDYCCAKLSERLMPRIWLGHSLVFSLFSKHRKD